MKHHHGALTVLIILLVCIVGCTSTSPSAQNPNVTHYRIGDIISTNDTFHFGFVILDYNESLDEYSMRIIHQTTGGSWGYFLPDSELIHDSAPAIDNYFTYLIGHVPDPKSIKTIDYNNIPSDAPNFLKKGIYQTTQIPIQLTVITTAFPAAQQLQNKAQQSSQSLTKFEQFEKGLNDANIKYISNPMFAQTIGAEEGRSYSWEYGVARHGGVELYRFKDNSQELKVVTQNKTVTIKGVGSFPVEAVNGDMVLIQSFGLVDETNKEKIIEIFYRLK